MQRDVYDGAAYARPASDQTRFEIAWEGHFSARQEREINFAER
jgi:hypothetical protein